LEGKERSQSTEMAYLFILLAHKSSPKKFKTELCKNWELTGFGYLDDNFFFREMQLSRQMLVRPWKA
jgi:hypothetical protein